jgi:hypothetical protein
MVHLARITILLDHLQHPPEQLEDNKLLQKEKATESVRAPS